MVSLISFFREKVTLHSFCHIEPAVSSRSFFWCCYNCYVHTDYFKDFLILKNSSSYNCLFLFPCLTFTLSFPFCSSLFLVSFTFSFSFSFCWANKHHGRVFPLLLVLWHWPPSAVGSWWRHWGCCIRQSIAVPVKGLNMHLTVNAVQLFLSLDFEFFSLDLDSLLPVCWYVVKSETYFDVSIYSGWLRSEVCRGPQNLRRHSVRN